VDWGRSRPSVCFQFLRKFPKFDDAKVEVRCYEAEAHGADGLMVMTILLEELAPDGGRTLHSHTVTRYYATLEETQKELGQAGFVGIEVFGHFGRERIGDPALRGRGRQVFLARKP